MANNKKFSQKIVDWMSGIDSDMPVIRSTPDQKPAKPSEGGPPRYRPSSGGIVTDPANDKYYANNPRFGVTTDTGRRMRDESRAFYNSDKGKNAENFVTIKGDKTFNPDRKRGSGFGDSYGSKSEWVSKDNPRSLTPKQLSDFISQHAAGNHGAKLNDFNDGLRVNKPSVPQKMWEEHPNQREHHTNMAKRGQAENIGKHVPNRDEYIKMQGKVPFSKANIVTHKGGLTDVDKVALGGMGGALGGEIISAGIDLEAAKKRRDSEVEKNQSSGVKSQADAHSYWSRKKSGQ